MPRADSQSRLRIVHLPKNGPLYTGFIQPCVGLSVGLAGPAAGFTVGIVGDARIRGIAQQVICQNDLILNCGEVLRSYGLIVTLLLKAKAGVITISSLYTRGLIIMSVKNSK